MNDTKKNGLFRFSGKEMKICLTALLVSSLIIMIAAFITAVNKIPREKAEIEEISENTFAPAEKLFKQIRNWTFFGIQQIREEVVSSLETGESPLNTLNEKLKGKYVIVQMPKGDVLDAATQGLVDRKKQAIQAEAESLNQQIEGAYWTERYQLVRQRDEKLRQLEKINRMTSTINQIRFQPETDLPYSRELGECHFLAGEFERFRSGRENLVLLLFTEVRPVLDDDFLKDNGVPSVVVSKKEISQDEDLIDKAESRIKEEMREKLRLMQERIDSQVYPRRESVRNDFYRRWFAVLFHLLGIYFSIRILVGFFNILRRKGVSGKSTEQIYYVTNMTSRILRCIALVIVVLGVLSLGIQGVVAVLSGFGSGGFSLNIKLLAMLFDFLALSRFLTGDKLLVVILYAFLTPFVHTLLTMIASWLWVLWSEFVCFISNVYHVLFIKVYGENKAGAGQGSE